MSTSLHVPAETNPAGIYSPPLLDFLLLNLKCSQDVGIAVQTGYMELPLCFIIE